MSSATLWRPERADLRAMLLVALIPILLAIPQLTPWLKADPLYYTANMALDRGSVIQRGVPYIDPNNGFQTEALGHRAALDWLSGEIPWWNPYTGIGMPLAAEYQPSAFFPLTMLLLLPRGMVLLQMSLQIIAGLGTFVVLRQLGMGRLAATMGGIVYGLNGTLAWFSHAAAAPVPFLPWFIYGIERAAIAAWSRLRGGWRTIGAAMALSLLAGFPETAYINGLLALAWAILRGVQLQSYEARSRFAGRVVTGGIAALAIASPQIIAFLQYLPYARLAGHAGEFANAQLYGLSAVTSLVAPYALGPIMGYGDKWELLYYVWGGQGGYVTIALLALAIYGLLARRDAISILLAAWIVTTLGKSFGYEPLFSMWNLVPGVTSAAFARYVQPSWELAVVILAAFGLDHVARAGPSRVVLAGTALLAITVTAGGALYFSNYRAEIAAAGGLYRWTFASFAWAIASVVLLVSLLYRRSPRSLRGAAALLAADAVLMCALPILSNPRDGRLDMEAVEFLRANLGLQRFYSTDPIQPNYGAYFGIASINHNYLPVPESWVQHVQRKLDRKWTDSVVFNGAAPRNSMDELRINVEAFQDLGVKYVVSQVTQDPVSGVSGIRQVYSDSLVRIFQLPNPRPYFEIAEGDCTIEARDRRNARVDCGTAAVMVRRELYFPGWTATINRAEVPIRPRGDVLQAIELPRGASEIRFEYAPPHIGWAWLACFLGIAALVTPRLLLRGKHQ